MIPMKIESTNAILTAGTKITRTKIFNRHQHQSSSRIDWNVEIQAAGSQRVAAIFVVHLSAR